MVIFGRVLQDLLNYLFCGDKDRDAKSFELNFSDFDITRTAVDFLIHQYIIVQLKSLGSRFVGWCYNYYL